MFEHVSGYVQQKSVFANHKGHALLGDYLPYVLDFCNRSDCFKAALPQGQGVACVGAIIPAGNLVETAELGLVPLSFSTLSLLSNSGRVE